MTEARKAPWQIRRDRLRRRRRGSTFTTFVIVFGVVLLGSATLYIDTTKQTNAYAAQQVRDSRLREAAFGGVRWAGHAAERWGPEGRGAFDLYGTKVEVSYKPSARAEGVALLVRSVARDVERKLIIDATLRSVNDTYRLESFEVRTQ